MPCNTITTAKIDLGKVDPELLKAAMAEQGYTPQQWSYVNSVLTIQGKTASEQLVSTVKKHYSKQVVYSQAKKYNWLIKETAPFEYEVIKR